MRSVLASVLVVTAITASSAQNDYTVFGAKGEAIAVTDACGGGADVNVTRASIRGAGTSKESIRVSGVWFDSFDEKARGSYTLSKGAAVDKSGNVRTGYVSTVKNGKLKYTAVAQSVVMGPYGYDYLYCSGDPFEPPIKFGTIFDVPSDDMSCEAEETDEGWTFAVGNDMETNLNGLKVTVTFNPPIDYVRVSPPPGVGARGPSSSRGQLKSFRPPLRGTLRPNGFHEFTVRSPSVATEDGYLGLVTIKATAGGGKLCVTELNTFEDDFSFVIKNGVVVEKVPKAGKAAPAAAIQTVTVEEEQAPAPAVENNDGA